MGYHSVFRTEFFKDRTIIVTGGGSGIGRCTAHELASLGSHVVIIGRKQEKLDRVVGEIEEDGGSAHSHSCDIRDEAKVAETVSRVVERRGQIHGLVNNAGGQYPAPIAAINQKGFETVVRTNLVGGFLMAREVFTQSMNRHGGAIVNITADHIRGMPGMSHSGAARAGMENFTMTSAFEWAPFGVRVNAVAPGWIASSGMDTYEGPIRALIPKLKHAVPLKRMGTESEVSSAICFLLSDAAAFITGATLRVDGAAPLGNSALWPSDGRAQNVTTFNGFHRCVTPDILSAESSPSEE